MSQEGILQLHLPQYQSHTDNPILQLLTLASIISQNKEFYNNVIQKYKFLPIP